MTQKTKTQQRKAKEIKEMEKTDKPLVRLTKKKSEDTIRNKWTLLLTPQK